MKPITGKKIVFAAACAGMLLFGICLITLGAVAPTLRVKFSLDALGTGTLFSILPFGILTGSVVFGPVCDRRGYKLILILACLAMFTGFEGIAYARSLWLLKVCVFLFGLGGGIINGATNAVVADISEHNKGANLSLLGVFFGLGALGMPLLLGVWEQQANMLAIIATTGWLTLVVALLYSGIQFPKAKQERKQQPEAVIHRLMEPVLLLIAAFLFLQSSLEAIINNWATSYLISFEGMLESGALYALSLHITGMVIMRFLTGSLLRRFSQLKILWICMLLLLAGIFLMQTGHSLVIKTAGLFLSGAGLSGGFPVMLGLAGERYADISATAFSFLFTIALVGNMLVNYLMGIIVQHYGIQHLVTVSYIEIIIMITIFFFVTRQLSSKK